MPSIAFPHVLNGVRYAGTAMEWNEKCVVCPTRQCERAVGEGLQLCSYGFNFQRITPELLLAGIVVREYQSSSPARTKAYRSYPDWIVPRALVDGTVRMIVETKQRQADAIQEEKTRIIEEYVEQNQYRTDFLDDLKQEIQKGLSFVHDYKQINTQIAQNINVIIETKYSGESLDEKLEQASHPEGAIYWASKFLQEKLNVARLLLDPSWITKDSEKVPFRFHGALLKYVRIYQYMLLERGIKTRINGTSTRNIFGNPQAIDVIPHTLLDNALKYSPKNERIDIFVSDEDRGIDFSVSSFGPKIESEERALIFQAFRRGIHAKEVHEEGSGFGLYVAQMVATQVKTRIVLEQSVTAHPANAKVFWTTFKVLLPYRC